MKHAIVNLFSHNLVTALSSTLIHSLWQGAILSAITGLIMTFTRKSSSARRYNLLVTALALFAVTVAVTFILQLNKTGVRTAASVSQFIVNSGPVSQQTTIYPPASPSSIFVNIGSYLNRCSSTIVWIWLLIVCVRCMQLATGLRSVYNLRYKDVFSMSGDWERRVQQLCKELGIKRLVGIVESARVKSPSVIGHLKPLILIPVGMFTSLSAEEAEAILLHELAHIRRADYLVNLLQNLMEIVLFFNPAVLWLSTLIKAERENCCDDMALIRSSKVNYIKALVACEEFNQIIHPYAMALKGNKGSLKNRVTRIVSNRNLPLNKREKSLLAACLIAVGIFATLLANGEKHDKVVANVRKASIEKIAPSHSKNKSDNKYLSEKHSLQQVKTTAATPPGVKEITAPAEPAQTNKNKYQDDSTAQHVDPHLGKLGASLGKLGVSENEQQAEKDKATSDADRTKSIIKDMIKDGIITSANGLSFKIGTDEFIVNYKKQYDYIYQKYLTKYVIAQHEGPGDWDWYYNYDKDKYKAANQSPASYTNSSTQYNYTYDKYKNVADAYGSQASARKKADADQTKSMINDLMKDGIITSVKGGFSFKLGYDEFIVNGKTQPADILDKYRAKYVSGHGERNWEWEHTQ